MAQLFEKLHPCKWRDVEFPITSITTSFEQDIASHKYWGHDGVNQESTGRDALTITVNIPFRNGVAPAKNEHWDVLYPDGWRAFVKACNDRTTGVFVHPELGEINCKVKTFRTNMLAERRDGVDVEATFVETTDPSSDDSPFANKSPITHAQVGARNLDASKDDLVRLVPNLPDYKPDFADSMRDIAAVGDTVNMLSKRAAGKIDSIVYRIDAIGESIDGARTSLAWPAKQSVDQIKSAARDLRQNLLSSGRKIVLYVVRARTTLAGLLPLLPGATFSDLVRLNPTLVRSPIVPVGAVVRYYAQI